MDHLDSIKEPEWVRVYFRRRHEKTAFITDNHTHIPPHQSNMVQQ